MGLKKKKKKIINDERLIEHLDFFIDECAINMNTFTYKSFKENKIIPLGKVNIAPKLSTGRAKDCV